ncbi:MAG: N-acetylmuramoyl-L-alanine amidase [Candidatus Paceibacterota bacterium]|jgi:N-acetylmuramoyl-L-alanine amidase
MLMKRSLLILFFLPIFFLVPLLKVEASVAKIIKILLIPGHDNEVWGAQYGNIKEADMNLAVATQIYGLLKKDKRFDVYITRDSEGYTKEFADFLTQKDAILAFEQAAKKIMNNNIISGNFIPKDNIPHHRVSEDIALRLYGFNKWADENKIDAMVHIHFNDYPRPKSWTVGQYKGFTIYMPDGQFANSRESGQLAADIFLQLNKKYITSTWKPEAGGLTPDQKLIAIGANNTLNASVRSVLIEYGYIYEKKFRTKSTRLAAYKNMSSLTTIGIKNYFFPTKKNILTPNPSP